MFVIVVRMDINVFRFSFDIVIFITWMLFCTYLSVLAILLLNNHLNVETVLGFVRIPSYQNHYSSMHYMYSPHSDFLSKTWGVFCHKRIGLDNYLISEWRLDLMGGKF